MGASRAFRIIEGSLVLLFFWESARLVFGTIIAMTGYSVQVGQASLLTVNGHVMLLVALAVPWFAPRSRVSLPRTLALSAIFAALLRIAASVNVPLVQLVASVGVIGFCSMYQATLIRANWRTWVTVAVIGTMIDLLFRAADTYDPASKTSFSIQLGETSIRALWIYIQIPVSITAVLASWGARRSARLEKYEPASLSLWGGLGVGGFFGLEFLVLNSPNVTARWTNESYNSIAPWLIFLGALPLIPQVRLATSHLLKLFDSRLRGWVWVLVIILAVVAGNRIGGSLGSIALILAQFMIISTLWWIPTNLDALEVEQVGPSFALGMIVFAILVYVYSFNSIGLTALSRLPDIDLISILVAGGLVGLVRLIWREDDPWEWTTETGVGLEGAFVAVVAVMTLLLVASGGEPARAAPRSTLSIATYNINGGFDSENDYQLDLAARTIEASLADIVILQQVDTGRPIGLGVDQAEYLARKLDMYQSYQPTSGKLLGVAVLSRWPIIEVSTAALPTSGQSNSAIRVVIRDVTSGRSITVLAAKIVPGSDQGKLNQLYALQTLAGDQGPLVIGLDLGDTPDSTTYQQILASGFIDPDVALGIEQGYTTPAINPTSRQDYVFVRGLVPIASRHVNSPASTHRLVVVEVGFPQ